MDGWIVFLLFVIFSEVFISFVPKKFHKWFHFTVVGLLLLVGLLALFGIV